MTAAALPRTLRVFIAAILLANVAVTTVSAQRADVPARMALRNQAGASDVVLTGRRGDVINARMGDRAGSATYSARDIERMMVFLPQDILRQAEAAAAAGQNTEAIRLMRGVIQPIIPYLDLPIEGAVEPALRYAEFLRRENAWAAAISIYRALISSDDPDRRQLGIGWRAYSEVRNRQFTEARETLAGFIVEDPLKPGFMPGALAAARLAYEDGDPQLSIDYAARASALARIDHELYAEALFLAANAYLRMAEKIAAEEARRAEERMNRTRIRNAANEEEILLPLTAAELTEVAAAQYRRLAELFPSSPFAGEATRQFESIQAKPAETAPLNTPVSPTGE